MPEVVAVKAVEAICSANPDKTLVVPNDGLHAAVAKPIFLGKMPKMPRWLPKCMGAATQEKDQAKPHSVNFY